MKKPILLCIVFIALTILQFSSAVVVDHIAITFKTQDNTSVGDRTRMEILFFTATGEYPITGQENIRIKVRRSGERIQVPLFSYKKTPNQLCVIFDVKMAGTYLIKVYVDNIEVKGSAVTRTYQPHEIDLTQTLFSRTTDTFCVIGIESQNVIQLCDKFGNRCSSIPGRFQLTTKEGVTGTINRGIIYEFVPGENEDTVLKVNFKASGHFAGMFSYDGVHATTSLSQWYVLTAEEFENLRNKVSNDRDIGYNGKLITEEGFESQDVYLTISSTTLIINRDSLEYPETIATFQILSTTILYSVDAAINKVRLTITQGTRQIRVSVFDVRLIMAAFTYRVNVQLDTIGLFQKLQRAFHVSLITHHGALPRHVYQLEVRRDDIIKSTWEATRNLTDAQWLCEFRIKYVGESGIDQGGLRRDWYELITSKLFEDGNPQGLFRSLPDSESRLVHPNPACASQLELYKMAGKIVGKAIYDSANGDSQLVKAKFTRSFLAQLNGFVPTYKHFENDDPSLYTTTVKRILDKPISDFGVPLTFSQDESTNLDEEKIAEFTPNGANVKVTDDNKIEYLNALAEYRLSTKMESQIDEFICGFKSIVPQRSLRKFDEDELELLLCGKSEYSVEDLLAHHNVSYQLESLKETEVLDWFYKLLGTMNEEQKGQLLQFATGSSLLPIGGFAKISPLLEIKILRKSDDLPTSHTCINQLWIPAYTSYDILAAKFKIALKFADDSFGFA